MDNKQLSPEDAEFVKKLRFAFEYLNKPEISVEPSPGADWKVAHSKLTQKLQELNQELLELKHQCSIGNNQALVTVALNMRLNLTGLQRDLKDLLTSVDEKKIGAVKNTLQAVHDSTNNMNDLLVSPFRRVFHFRQIRRWKTKLREGLQILDLTESPEKKQELLFVEFVPKQLTAIEAVISEIRYFSTSVLFSSASDEEERDTTHYLTLTTIATFFSSMTVTTLQFSLVQTTSSLGNVVNLLWFLSLVFSVSSGINSLLSMTWRKSSIYLMYTPSSFILIWLEKAPMVFLAISAFMFVVGLNIFPYSSQQTKYLSIATNLLTSLHILGLLLVTAWYLIKRKWKSAFILSTRRHLLWAFLRDTRVVKLNEEIGKQFHFRAEKLVSLQPHPLAKMIRRVVSSWKSTGEVMCFSEPEIDAERGFCHLVGDLEFRPDKQITDKVDEALGSYFHSLKKAFPITDIVEDGIVWRIQSWNLQMYDIIEMETELAFMLWGYPQLMDEFRQKVLPELHKLRIFREQEALKKHLPIRLVSLEEFSESWSSPLLSMESLRTKAAMSRRPLDMRAARKLPKRQPDADGQIILPAAIQEAGNVVDKERGDGLIRPSKLRNERKLAKRAEVASD